MDFTSSSTGIRQWVSELQEMEDPTPGRHMGNLFSPSGQQVMNMMKQNCNNLEIPTFFQSYEQGDSPSAQTKRLPPISALVGSFTDHYRPMKMPRRNTWETTVPSQTFRTQNSAPISTMNSIQQTGHFVQPEQDTCTEVHSCVDTNNNSEREVPHSPHHSFGRLRRPPDLLLEIKSETFGASQAPLPLVKGPGHTQDHIMAERKRREKLSQRFIALSAIVPGLKKTDKASVLGDAIKYVKQLQDKVKTLEESSPKAGARSIASVKVAAETTNEETGVDDKPDEGVDDAQRPEIAARMIGKNVLIRIHCEKKKGVLAKSLAELEKLHLVVMNANVLSFSETSFDLTLNAEMEEGPELTADDVVNALLKLFKT